MTCPVCGGGVRVIDVWKYDCETTYRKLKCGGCGHIFYTKEEEVPAHHWGPEGFRRFDSVQAPTGAKWDTDAGRRMYDEGKSIAYISRTLNVKYNTVYMYAYKHWFPKRG